MTWGITTDEIDVLDQTSYEHFPDYRQTQGKREYINDLCNLISENIKGNAGNQLHGIASTKSGTRFGLKASIIRASLDFTRKSCTDIGQGQRKHHDCPCGPERISV